MESTPATPGVTVLIPTWNAGGDFPAALAAIQRQRVDRALEILVIDSGSTDGTVEFLRRHPIRLVEIPNHEFNHGLTRARGIREARGEIVVLLVQDAQPADDLWLQRLIDAFDDDHVAGAYSCQIPRADAAPFIRDRIRHAAPPSETPQIRSVASPAAYEGLAPAEKARLASFDNVSSAVRRRVALDIPFTAARFGEDLDWGRRVLLAGYKIVYEPRSKVIHSHNRSAGYEFRRVFLDHQVRYRLFGVRRVPRRRDVIRSTLGSAASAFRIIARDRDLRFAARVVWAARALPYSFGQSLAQYLGAKSAIAGENSRFYRWLVARLARGI